MRTRIHHTTSVPQPPFPSLEALLAEPCPRTPEDLLQLAQRLSTAAVQGAAQMVRVQLTRAHEDEAGVRQAIAPVRAHSPVPRVHKGCRTPSGLLLGGTCLVLEMPSLREDRRGRRGRHRRTRGPHGAGDSPVLAALGLADRVSPASRSAVALHVGQAARSREAAALLARRGLACDVSRLVRLTTAPAEARTRLRAAAREAALRRPVAPDGPLAARTAGARRPRDATAVRHPGASHGCG